LSVTVTIIGLAAGADSVVVSGGADGMIAVTPEGVWRAGPPERVAGNPTGAGDAAVAALTAGLVEGTTWPERLADAVALSAAAVGMPVAGGFDEQLYQRLRNRVEAEALTPAAGDEEGGGGVTPPHSLSRTPNARSHHRG
jgi:fructose-1-phosphate kinase PfkB-like protein